MTRSTQGERLTILETEARMRAGEADKAMAAVVEELKKINKRLDKIEEQHAATDKRLASYENKGKGALFGVGIVMAGVGAGIFAAFDKILAFIR